MAHRSPLLFLLLLPALLTAPSSPLPPCPADCQPMRCPPRSAQACLAVGGELQLDSCGCCWDCAPGEGQPCAPGGLCARGFFCHRRPGSPGPGTCSCVEGPLGVCGSDGRTYSSLCQLRARNHQPSSGHQPPVVPVHKGNCGEAGGCRVLGGRGVEEKTEAGLSTWGHSLAGNIESVPGHLKLAKHKRNLQK